MEAPVPRTPLPKTADSSSSQKSESGPVRPVKSNKPSLKWQKKSPASQENPPRVNKQTICVSCGAKFTLPTEFEVGYNRYCVKCSDAQGDILTHCLYPGCDELVYFDRLGGKENLVPVCEDHIEEIDCDRRCGINAAHPITGKCFCKVNVLHQPLEKTLKEGPPKCDACAGKDALHEKGCKKEVMNPSRPMNPGPKSRVHKEKGCRKLPYINANKDLFSNYFDKKVILGASAETGANSIIAFGLYYKHLVQERNFKNARACNFPLLFDVAEEHCFGGDEQIAESLSSRARSWDITLLGLDAEEIDRGDVFGPLMFLMEDDCILAAAKQECFAILYDIPENKVAGNMLAKEVSFDRKGFKDENPVIKLSMPYMEVSTRWLGKNVFHLDDVVIRFTPVHSKVPGLTLYQMSVQPVVAAPTVIRYTAASFIHGFLCINVEDGEDIQIPEEWVKVAKSFMMNKTRSDVSLDDLYGHMKRWFHRNDVTEIEYVDRLPALASYVLTDIQKEVRVFDTVARNGLSITNYNNLSVDGILETPFRSLVASYVKKVWKETWPYALLSLFLIVVWLRFRVKGAKWSPNWLRWLFFVSAATKVQAPADTTQVFARFIQLLSSPIKYVKEKFGTIYSLARSQQLHDTAGSLPEGAYVLEKGWYMRRPTSLRTDEALTYIKPHAIVSFCNDLKELIPHDGNITELVEGSTRCKPGIGVVVVGLTHPTIHPSAARKCIHNEIVAINNRGIPDAPRHRPLLWEFVYKYIHSSFEHTVDLYQQPLKPMEMEKWLARFNLARREKLRAGYQRFLDQNCHVTPGDLIRETHIKVEKQGTQACGEELLFDPRLIQGASPTYQAATGPITYSISKRLAACWGKYEGTYGPITYAAGMSAEQVGDWFEYAVHKCKKPVFVTGDFSRLDNTVRAGALQFEHSVYRSMGVARKHLKIIFDRGGRNRGVLRSGTYYQVQHTRCSGDGNTSCGNTVITAGAYHAYFEHYRITHYIICMGDDAMVVVDGEFELKQLEKFLLLLGLKPKLNKTEEAFECEFLSSRWWPTDDGWKLGPKPGRILARLGYTYKIPAPGMEYIWLKSVMQGLEYETSHVPIAADYIGHYLTLLTGIQAPTIHEDHKVVAKVKTPISEKALTYASQMYGVSKELINDFRALIWKIDHPTVAVNHPVFDRIIEVDYPPKWAANLLLHSTNPWINIIAVPIIEEVLKRYVPYARHVLPWFEFFAYLYTFWGQAPVKSVLVVTRVAVLCLHYSLTDLPSLRTAILIHILWNLWSFIGLPKYTKWRLGSLLSCIGAHAQTSRAVKTTMEKPHGNRRKRSFRAVPKNSNSGKESSLPEPKEVIKAEEKAIEAVATAPNPTAAAAAITSAAASSASTRRRGKYMRTKNKTVSPKVPATMPKPGRSPTRRLPRFSMSSVSKEYLQCLLNPQVAAEQGLSCKFPDEFNDKTTALFGHTVIETMPLLANTSSLEGPVVYPALKDNSFAVHVKPDLNSPIRVLQVDTPTDESGVIISAHLSEQTENYGFFQPSSGSSVSQLTGRLTLNDRIVVVAAPYSYSDEPDALHDPVRFTNDFYTVGYGYPCRFNTFTFTMQVVVDPSMGVWDPPNPPPGLVNVLIQDAETNIIMSATFPTFYSANADWSHECVSGLTTSVMSGPAGNWNGLVSFTFESDTTVGANRWPGNVVSLINNSEDAYVPITVVWTNLTFDSPVSTPLCRYKVYEWPALIDYQKNFDKFRVTCLSMLVSNVTAAIFKGGTVASNLMRGGEPCNYINGFNPTALADTTGAYTGSAELGTYVIWHPYDLVDMKFAANGSAYASERPYLMAAGALPTGAVEPQLKLTVYIGFEAVSHSQILSLSQSPVDPKAVAEAFYMWKKRGIPVAMENSFHSFITEIADKAWNSTTDALSAVSSKYEQIPAPIREAVVPLIAGLMSI